MTLQEFGDVFENEVFYICSGAIILDKRSSKHISKSTYKDYRVIKANRTQTGIAVEVDK